jgi:hypothetical protein
MNHAFITVRGKLPSPEQIETMLKEIVAHKWGDALVVTSDGDSRWSLDAAVDPKFLFGLGVWIAGAQKIEMRKSPGDLSSWLQAYVQSALAVRIQGLCGDEGIDNRWEGTPEEYDTFEKWWAAGHRGWPSFDLPWVQKLWIHIVMKVPKELLGNPLA